MKKILIIRTDRLGDVILTTPIAGALKKRYSDCRVTFWVKEYTKEIVENCNFIDSVITFPENKGLLKIIRKIKKEKFDISILVHPSFKLALIIFLAQIPIRIGTGFRVYSFLFNKRWYEHRKYSILHEVDYNLNLLKTLEIEENNPEFSFRISPEAENHVEKLLIKLGINKEEKIIVLHPGSGRSAPGWSFKNFSILSDSLIDSGYTVLITGGKNDRKIVEKLLKNCKKKPFVLTDILNLKELMALLKRVKIFVSNSTGPLHLAVALGTTVLGLYPPLVTASIRRWGPYNKKEFTLTPEIPECKKCIKEKCKYYDCMNLIKTETVFNKIISLIGN